MKPMEHPNQHQPFAPAMGHQSEPNHHAASQPTSGPESQPMSGPESRPMQHGDTTAHVGQDEMAGHVMAEDGVMVMSGIPLWVFILGIIGVLVVSFFGVERFGAHLGNGFRFTLTKRKKVYDILRHRALQFVPQMIAVVIFGGLIVSGLWGSQVRNITPVAVWTIWWGGLIFAILMMGPLFCFACPWDGLANLFTRFPWLKRAEPLTMGLRFPAFLRNVYPAILLFVALTWLELGVGVTTSPSATAFMGLGIAALAVGTALVFEGKPFCHWMCPVGRISGIYANFSPVEVRRRNANVCSRCKTHDCLNGNENGYPCPTGILLKDVRDASYCTMCSECFKSCNKRNVALNIRPFGTDLRNVVQVRWDEAWLALSLLTLTLFHGFSMTSWWESYTPGKMSFLKWMAVTFKTPDTFNFTVGMVVVCAVPIGLYWLACKVGAKWAGGHSIGTGELFRKYSFSLLPVALFYHLAHNTMHILHEGTAIIALLSDPLGRGWDLFGTANYATEALVSDGVLWTLQVGLILVGHLFGIVVAHRVGHSLYNNKKAALRSLLPMLAMMIFVSVIGLGLMHLDMNMRMGRM